MGKREPVISLAFQHMDFLNFCVRGTPLRVVGYEEWGGGNGVGEAVWRGGGLRAGETTRDASCDLSPLGQGQGCLVACQHSMAPVASLLPLATLLPYATLAAGIWGLNYESGLKR